MKLLEASLLEHSVFAIIEQVSHVRDVLDLQDLIADEAEVADDDIERHVAFAMTDV
jgi:hypothetical protein